MNSSLSTMLDAVLTKHGQEVQCREEQERIKNMKREEFLLRFDEVAEQIILPAAKEFVGELESKGHGMKVSFASSVRPQPGAITTYGGVFTHFLPNKLDKGSGLTPSMRFVPASKTEELQVFGTCLEPQSGGKTFDLGTYSLEKVDRGIIQKMLLQLVDGGLAFTNFKATRKF
jgi:hypothetical protein